jgi:putative transposase
MAARNVSTGQVTGSCNPTRTEEDFLKFIIDVFEQDPGKEKCHFICDNLNTHKSISLVHFVAAIEGDEQDLGVKGRSGILKSLKSREKYLTDPSHVVVFHYTPKHSSWLNQIEVWFSILVRKLLRWVSVKSVDQLKTKICRFINYYNKTMAKAFRWKYKP